MTYEELVKTIQTLSVAERLSLLEILTLSLQADFPRQGEHWASVAEVRGMLKVDGPAPKDDEIIEAYTDYLNEKCALCVSC